MAESSIYTQSSISDSYQIRRIKRYAFIFAGGWSLLLALSAYLFATQHKEHVAGMLYIHCLIWLFGLGISVLSARKLIGGTLLQLKTEAELHEQARRLEQEIAERQAAQESLQEGEKRYQLQNRELLAIEEMLRVRLREHEEGQEQLKESNHTLQAIFDVSPLPIVISSFASGVIQDVNQTFCLDFGLQRHETIGKTGFDLGIWSDAGERQDFLGFIGENTCKTGYPAEIKNVHGEVRSVRIYSAVIDYKHEKSLLLLFMDVTDQKRIENELRQAQKMEVVGQLAGGVAHDFNNMLTAIIGSAEMMERYVSGNNPQEKLLKTIQEASRRSADLTGQLLSFSRKGSKMTVQVWAHKVIRSVIDMLERTIDKSISLETRLTATNDLLIGDPTQLQNALLNLGVNARDAMPDGGTITYATATVVLDSAYCRSHGGTFLPGAYLEISVSDTGTGIEKKILDRIFEPFFTTKGIGHGTGLGLAAVYGTIKEHHGSINVYSEPGIGSVFKLYLPLATEQHHVETDAAADIQGSGGILLVDDEQLIREMGQALLEEHGYRVFLAEDGLQALDIYAREKENIRLVILDVVMPVMGGKETLQRLITAYPDVRVLVSSGFHQDDTNDSYMRLGARGFIQKPYRTNELFKAVDEALR